MSKPVSKIDMSELFYFVSGLKEQLKFRRDKCFHNQVQKQVDYEDKIRWANS